MITDTSADTPSTFVHYWSTVYDQGVIQDFEVEGGNEKSNQKMLLKKRSTVISMPSYGHSVIFETGGRGNWS